MSSIFFIGIFTRHSKNMESKPFATFLHNKYTDSTMDGTVAFRSVNKKFPESYNSAARSRRTVKLNAILQRILKDHLILKK